MSKPKPLTPAEIIKRHMSELGKKSAKKLGAEGRSERARKGGLARAAKQKAQSTEKGE
jgi:hypothetical protein